jgi:hypothetical protein
MGNPNLGFEKRMNISLGFDGLFLQNKLALEGSVFYYKTSDVITKRKNTIPQYFSSLYWDNYGSYTNTGFEFGGTFTQKFADIVVMLGSNLVYSVPKTLAIDELNYSDDYRKAAGKPSDAMFGFVALGLFNDQTEINNSTPQTFGIVRPGDIRYQDLNNDNVIDDLDQKVIGNSHARFDYSFNLNVKYKSFELFALANGETGASTYFNSPYYWVYGNRKYSDAVLNRWTGETAETATYPRLTTLAADNNYRNSTYWLYKKNWFTLQTIQLNYAVPVRVSGIKELRVFARANNLATFSKIADKLQLNIGTAPQTRFYSVGASLTL